MYRDGLALNDAQIRGFQPEGKRYRKSDGRGLYLEVMPTGLKLFRLACRLNGQQRTFFIGEYPKMRLADARLKASEYKQKAKEGRDPTVDPELELAAAKRNEPKWGQIAQDYVMLRQRSGAAQRTLTKLQRQIDVTIAAVGDRAISDITAQDVLDVVNPIAEAGHIENAHEVRSRFSQVFRYAAARGLIQSDPAAMTIDAMVPRRRGEFAGLTDPVEVGRLISKIRQYRERNLLVGSALLLSAYLFPRNSELRGMRWSEIDPEKWLWELPGERMKMGHDHIVPLPTQAREVLLGLRKVDFGTDQVFPAPRDPNKLMSDNTYNKALRSMGYSKRQHVHHGFRTTASTLLNELNWNSDWIERQLAHVQQNRVRASYNKAEYLDGRIRMMQAYADHLDELSAGRK